MKANAPLWLLGLLLFAAGGCAADRREAMPAPEGAVAEGTAPAEAEAAADAEAAAAALALFEAELEKFKAKVRPEGPAMADLTRHFFVLWRRGALAGAQPKSALEQLALHKAPGREGNDYFLVWLEETGHDMSKERACGELYQAHAQLAPGRPEMRYFFCGGKAGFELLSSYRQAAGGWTRVD